MAKKKGMKGWVKMVMVAVVAIIVANRVPVVRNLIGTGT